MRSNSAISASSCVKARMTRTGKVLAHLFGEARVHLLNLLEAVVDHRPKTLTATETSGMGASARASAASRASMMLMAMPSVTVAWNT
jgi:hypothetical protein